MAQELGLNILSGNLLLGQLLKSQLEASITQLLTVVLDAPWGYAFSQQQALQSSASLIITDNPCGEFIEDLWDLHPTVLIAKQIGLDDLVFFCKQALQGNRLKIALPYQSPLTKAERKILRLSALHISLEEMSKRLNIGHGTLKNTLTHIYDKLELSGKEELGLYYLGALKNPLYLLET